MIQVRRQRILSGKSAEMRFPALYFVALSLQRWVRAKQQRRRYLEDRRKVIVAQKAAKRWLRRRNEAASTIQQAVRKFLLLRHQRKFEQGIIKAQVQPLMEELDKADSSGFKGLIIRLTGGTQSWGYLLSSSLSWVCSPHVLLLFPGSVERTSLPPPP